MSSPSPQRVEVDLAGKKFFFETGWLAKQANGAVMAGLEETYVLGAAVAGKGREGLDFFPLQIDYREKMTSAGRFPGGFIKREGRPTTKEILTCRLSDRPIRPLFPEGYFADLQVYLTVYSADTHNDPDIVAMNAASASLHVSDLPFKGPVGSVRVGLLNGNYVVNPTYSELEESDLDLIISGTKDGIIMVEAGSKEISEEEMLGAFDFAIPFINQLIEAQDKLREMAGKPKAEATVQAFPQELFEKMKAKFRADLESNFFIKVKQERSKALSGVKENAVSEYLKKDEQGNLLPDSPSKLDFNRAWDKVMDEVVREFAIDNRRSDGRGLQDIRPIYVQLGILPRTHGSAVFTRGETQALVTTTLGTKSDEQLVEGLGEPYSDSFMLHYNFPSFSVGEAKPIRGPGRREIGHGDLAWRGVKPVLPDQEDFPYTIRAVSDILESNGSSSMASICGAVLSMMDAGVPLKSPVAGIAMGLIQEKDKVAILTDILGSEDAHGDMDFKVAGSEKGITALQMDLKAAGISMEIVRNAVAEARTARMHILEKMKEAIAEPRTALSQHAPRLEQIKIDSDKIGLVIGPGGKMIREIEATSGAKIEINEDNSGRITIACKDSASLEKAATMISNLTEDLKVGKIYQAKVVSVKDFGCFCEILGKNQDGLVHVTEMTDERGIRVEDYVKMGLEVEVKVLASDPQGRTRFSIKEARRDKELPSLPRLDGKPAPPPGPRGGGRFNDSRPAAPRPGGPAPGGQRPPVGQKQDS